MNKPYYFGYWLYSIHDWENKLNKLAPLKELYDNNIHKSDHAKTSGSFFGIELSSDMVIFLKLKYDIFIREFENFYWVGPDNNLNETYENMIDDIIENLNHNDN